MLLPTNNLDKPAPQLPRGWGGFTRSMLLPTNNLDKPALALRDGASLCHLSVGIKDLGETAPTIIRAGLLELWLLVKILAKEPLLFF
jgi:hypothetical protein